MSEAQSVTPQLQGNKWQYGRTVAVCVVIVAIIAILYYGCGSYLDSAHDAIIAKAERFTAKKKVVTGGKKSGFSEDDVEQFLNTSSPGTLEYDPSIMSLDKGIIDSHREFTDEVYNSATGANATDVIRDDTNEVNVRVGLRRVDYTSVFSGEDARTVSSETPDQVSQKTGSFVL